MAEEIVPSVMQTPVTCDLCENNDIENEVSWYCLNCEANLCCNCQIDHQEGKPGKIFKKHKIVPRLDAHRSKVRRDEQCRKHAGDFLILHCNNCHQLVCNNCIIEEHNGHDFCAIEVAMKLVRRDILQYSQAIESKVLTKCFKMETAISDIVETCEDFYARKESDVQKKRNELTCKVNSHYDGVLQTIEKEKKKNMSIIDQDKIAVQAKIQEIKMLLNTKKEAMRKRNSDIIKFLNEKQAISDVSLPTISSLQLPSFIDEQIECFQVVVKSCLTTGDQTRPPQRKISFDGDEDGQHTTPITTYANETNGSSTTYNKDNSKVSRYTKTGVTDVQILSMHKYEIPVKNIEFVDKETAWICDMNTKTLMLVNTKGETLQQITTKCLVDDFKVVSTDNFITTHFQNKFLLVMSGKGNVKKEIKTPYYPTGICLTDDRKHVVVCFYDRFKNSGLAVMGLDGEYKDIFHYTDRKTSNLSLQRVTTNQSGDYCVAHNGLDAVFVVSKSGTLKFKYDGSNVTPKTTKFWPYDIACDKNDNLLVSDCGNDAIHMVDQQGNFIGYLLTLEDGAIDPRGLCIDNKGKLLVGLYDGTLLVVKYLK